MTVVTKRTGVLLGVWLGVAACADIDAWDEGECGNNVVEPDDGEDCDLVADPALGDDLVCGPPDGGAQQCRYVCDGAECPIGWACEDDGICRPPSGEFEADDEPVVRLAAQQIALHDVLGAEEAELVTRMQGDVFVFATDDDVFEPAIQVSLPHARGDLSFADIDGDEHTDLLAPAVSRALGDDATPRVHALRAEPDRWVTAIVPQRLAPEPILTSVAVDVGPDGGQTSLQLVADDDGGLALRIEADGCGATGPGTRLSLPDPVEPPPPTPVGLELAGVPHVAIAGTDATSVGVYTLVDPCNQAPILAQSVALPEPLGPRGCLALDIDADGDTDLACAVASGLAVAISDGTALASEASVGAVGSDALADLPAGQPRACEPTTSVLAATDLDGDGDTDLVTSHGIFVATPSSYARVYARESGDAWGEAVVGDFDRDGRADIVATVLSADAGCTSVQLTALVPTQGAYGSRLVRGGTLAHDLVVGDFDGDDIDDVAAVVPDTEDTRVAVYFGDTKEALEDLTSVGGFASVSSIATLRSQADAPINVDRIDDLMIVSEAGEFTTLVTGTSTRALLSPLVPPNPPGDRGRRSAQVLAGALRPTTAGTSDDAPPPDVLALYGPRAWLYRGDDVHHGDDPVVLDLGGTGLRPDCTSWAHGPASERGALLVGIDGHVPRIAEVEVACDLAVPPTAVLARLDDAGVLQTAALAVPGDPRRPTATSIVDLDLDGRDDVLVHFSHAGAVRSGSVWWLPAADPATSAGAALQPLVADVDVLAATILNADADIHPELALWTSDGLRIADFDPAREPSLEVSDVLVEATQSITGDEIVGLAAGDLDGDGLDDLALLVGDAIYLFPAVPRT